MIEDYSEACLQYYYHPKHLGSMDHSQPNVGTGQVGSEANGEVVRLQIQIDGEKIIAACFKAQGSCVTIAAASFCCDWLENKGLKDITQLTVETIVAKLSLPKVKIHCALLAIDALKAAAQDYQQKHY